MGQLQQLSPIDTAATVIGVGLSVGGVMTFADYRELFERCLQMAERHPQDRDTLLKIATQLLLLADVASEVSKERTRTREFNPRAPVSAKGNTAETQNVSAHHIRSLVAQAEARLPSAVRQWLLR